MRSALNRTRTCVSLPTMAQMPTRRKVLRLIAGAPLLASGAASAAPARTAAIERLMREAEPLPRVSQRLDFISGKLIGTRYRADTLIGSPKQQEQFVVRDDAFDCVTFCEVVLAAAVSRGLDQFEAALRRIRYDHGTVQYDRRNHYFADWCKHNIENGICRPVAIESSTVIDKTVTWHSEFGKRQVSMRVIDQAALFANSKLLAPGDIIGFASRRPGLDYYHTGFIAFGKSGELLLRSAALSHGRVLDEKMTSFVAVNPVKYVTLLRAAESAPVAERN
jgi:N-acetylmuramoyl-L-alanine amidase-like